MAMRFLSWMLFVTFPCWAQNYEFTAKEVESLNLHNSMGSVSVAATLNQQAGVAVEKKKWGERCILDVKLENGELRVNSDDQNWIMDNECRVDFIVSVPKRLKSEIKVGIGKVEVSGLEGELRVKVGNGSAAIKGNFAQLSALTGQGDIVFSGPADKVDLRSGLGNVEVQYQNLPEDDLLQVDVGRGEKIASAGDMRDALPGIVHHHGKMVARRYVLALDHDIAPARRLTENAL